MPGLYDRAICASELRLRCEILTETRGAWAPVGPFEIPNKTTGGALDAESSSAESTSIMTRHAENQSEVDISDLYDIRDKDGSAGFV